MKLLLESVKDTPELSVRDIEHDAVLWLRRFVTVALVVVCAEAPAIAGFTYSGIILHMCEYRVVSKFLNICRR